MDLYGIGFSNIRFANDNVNYVYRYSSTTNTFSEEVFMHEFLHTLERTSKEHGYDTVDLHNYEDYGYDNSGIDGLSDWYEDYLKCKILDKKTNQYVGLNDEVFKYKPVNENNFKFALEVTFNKEPENIIEEIEGLFNVLVEAI